ncbi:MAG: hypothetical protein EOP24_41075 [Hyphomicrobiales bacterium]|nr:MAG: hypothetical protein EOP24_41075 [Hyphomicrobiales bacterium]
MLGTINNAGRVLDLFTTADPEGGVSEVAAKPGVPKSSAPAWLAPLTEIGLLRRIPVVRYLLGCRIPELNRTLVDSSDFLTLSRGWAQRLANNFRASMHVAALRESKLIYLDKVVGGVSRHHLVGCRTRRSRPLHRAR